jgi:hypothetical protein
MKIQPTNCEQGRKRNFGFASILCSFFFERVSGLGPRVDIILHGPCDPSMAQWTEVMRQLGGGRLPTPYNDDFFFWWRRQVIALEDYPYAGIEFRGDLNMPLPPGSAYGDTGMQNFFEYFKFFLYFCISKQKYFWMMSSTN